MGTPVGDLHLHVVLEYVDSVADWYYVGSDQFGECGQSSPFAVHLIDLLAVVHSVCNKGQGQVGG